jgi:hypothetical protein
MRLKSLIYRLFSKNGVSNNKSKCNVSEEINNLALSGNLECQYLLGFYYETGHDVKKDIAQAIKWYITAAERGHIQAQFTLGILYSSDEDDCLNYPEAIKWLKLAAKNHHKDADLALSSCLTLYIDQEYRKTDQFKRMNQIMNDSETKAFIKELLDDKDD